MFNNDFCFPGSRDTMISREHSTAHAASSGLPGPGNAIVLSADHPTHPHRILFPVWLGPDGSTTSASLFYTDDLGQTFKQTETSWPKDGNDESTIAELQDGTVLYITRSNTSPCSSADSASRCLELARSTDVRASKPPNAKPRGA